MSKSRPVALAPSEEPPLAVLSDAALQGLCSAAVFGRGLTYARSGAVQVISEETDPCPVVHAHVAGTQTYTTDVWIEDEFVDGDCDCANAAEGWFCKHQVAVALIWRDRLSGIESSIDETARKKVQASAKRAQTVRDKRDALLDYLHAQPASVLADKLMDFADRDPSIMRELQHWRKISEAPMSAADLKALVTEILAPGRSFLDWRGSFDYARQAEVVLPLLQQARAQDPEAATALALHAMRRLWSVLDQADDSNGDISSVCDAIGAEWVAALQAAGPRPAAFGDTYLRIRLDDPFGTFDRELAEAAMGGPALESYRRTLADRWREAQDAVHALKEKYPRKALGGRPSYLAGTERAAKVSDLVALTCQHLQQLEVVGDIDGALAVLRTDLSRPEAYVTVTRFLQAHDRPRDAFANAEQACRTFPGDWRLEADLLGCYERDGWTTEALALRRQQFERDPTIERYHEVLKAARAAGADLGRLRAGLMKVLEGFEAGEMSRRPGPRRGAPAPRDVSLRAAVLCSESRWSEAFALVQPPNVCRGVVLRTIAVHLDDTHREHAVALLLRVLANAMDVATTPYREELAVVREIVERMDPARRATWLANLRVQYKAKRNFVRDLPSDA